MPVPPGRLCTSGHVVIWATGRDTGRSGGRYAAGSTVAVYPTAVYHWRMRSGWYLRQVMADRERIPTADVVAHRQSGHYRDRVLQRYGRLVASAMRRGELTPEEGAGKVVASQGRTIGTRKP